MRKFFFVLMLFLLASLVQAASVEYFSETNFQSVVTSRSTITFEELAAGQTLTGNEYAAQGLTFVQRSGQTMTVGAAGTFPGLSKHLASTGDQTGPNKNFDFIFSSPRTAVGIWFMNLYYHMDVSFLRADNSVIASEDISYAHPNAILAPSNYDMFYGIVTDQAIARVRVTYTQSGGDYLGFDNIQFGAVIPEINSFVLLGLVGIGILLIFPRSKA